MPEETMIGRYLSAREQATVNGDAGLVREIDYQLTRLGYRPDVPASVDRAEQAADAEAAPRGRGQTRRSVEVD